MSCHYATIQHPSYTWKVVSDVHRVERFRLTWRFFDSVSSCRQRRDLLFQFRLQIFRRRVGIFSLFFLCCFYFLL